MKTAFLFNGQGAQTPQMGLSFDSTYYQDYPEVYNLIKHGTQEQLNQTENSQRSILLTSMVIYEEVIKHIEPDYLVGLSLGEYSALVAAGALDVPTAMDLVTKRGQYMAEDLAPIDSKMSAVLSGDVDLIQNIVDQAGCYIANLNSPTQIVMTGLSEAVDQAKQMLRDQRIRTIDLKVSGAFHSPYLKPASTKLRKLLDTINFQDLTIPVIFNLTAQPQDRPMADLLEQQIISPVRFQQSIEYLLSQGVKRFVEIGPGQVTSSFVKKISPTSMIYSVNQIDDLKGFI